MDIGEQYGISDLRHLISQPFPSAYRDFPPPHQQLPYYGLFFTDATEDVGLSPLPDPVPESPPPPCSSNPPDCKVGFVPGFADEKPGRCAPAEAAGLLGEGGGGGGGGGGGCSHSSQGVGRWPRQETLTLLEIRSRLDSRFKDAAQKAPLWDEVSRIMAEEHGYQRSGKKCREKLENLYKYYKKTREGKAGRHDGRHYRFFRQLEALYGSDHTTTTATAKSPAADANTTGCHHVTTECSATALFHMLSDHHSSDHHLAQSNHLDALGALGNYENLSLSSSSTFDCSSLTSSERGGAQHDAGRAGIVDTLTAAPEAVGDAGHGDEGTGQKRRRRSWKARMREFVDLQLQRFMAVHEVWLERMLATLDHKEQERVSREEEWQKQKAERFEKGRKLWAKERAWIEARDAALIDALEKLSSSWARECEAPTPDPEDKTSVDEGEDSDTRNSLCDSESSEGTANNRGWPEAEVTCLIQLRTGLEGRFQEGGCQKNVLWEEISSGMRDSGYERRAKRCKEKWESISKDLRRRKKCHKKRKEDTSSCPYYENLDSFHHSKHDNRCGGAETVAVVDEVVKVTSETTMDAAVAGSDGCFLSLLDGEMLWEANGAGVAVRHTRIHTSAISCPVGDSYHLHGQLG